MIASGEHSTNHPGKIPNHLKAQRNLVLLQGCFLEQESFDVLSPRSCWGSVPILSPVDSWRVSHGLHINDVQCGIIGLFVFTGTPGMTAILVPKPDISVRPLRILYAEDLLEMRQLAHMMLTSLGHSLECCDNGRLAWDRVRVAPDAFDLVITDHLMPVMTGLEFVTRLRTIPFRGRIIVLSSDIDPRTASLYRTLKVDQILNKPIMPRMLLQVIAELFAAES